jgi:hypothetical protein
VIRFRLFNASPGDVAEERAALADTVVPELRRILSAFADAGAGQVIELDAIRWETHSWPDVGADAQDVVNKQISDFDIFVGIMWQRFGTPTKRAASGTGEEFERAFDLHAKHGVPRIMFYFRTAPFYPRSSEEIDQFKRVFKFKERLEKLGVRYWEYNAPIDFERYVREHLIRQILDLSYSTPKLPSAKPAIEAPQIPSHSVFISYTPEDRELAKRIALNLNEAGARTWLDVNNLLPGQAWQSEIASAIRRSNVFLLLLSRHVAGKRGYIQKEIRYALDEMKQRPADRMYIIPVRLDDSPVPSDLASLQWVDMFPDWSAGLDAIVRALRAVPASS